MLKKDFSIYINYFQGFKSKRLDMINKDRNFFQYYSGDLVYLISLLAGQLSTASRKVGIKYVGS